MDGGLLDQTGTQIWRLEAPRMINRTRDGLYIVMTSIKIGGNHDKPVLVRGRGGKLSDRRRGVEWELSS